MHGGYSVERHETGADSASVPVWTWVQIPVDAQTSARATRPGVEEIQDMCLRERMFLARTQCGNATN